MSSSSPNQFPSPATDAAAVQAEATAASTAHRMRNAFAAKRSVIAAVPESELVMITLDVTLVITTVLGCIPKIVALRPAVVEELPKFPIAAIDDLAELAYATGEAHTRYLTTSAPTQPIEQLTEELKVLHDLLEDDVRVLSKRNLIDGQKLKELNGPQGTRHLAFDVLMMANLLHESWSRIQNRTGVTLEEIDRAVAAAEQLIDALGLRAQAPVVVSEAAMMRHKAFSLLVNTYDEVRRAVGYLRWHKGDADKSAPSLYASRQTGKRKTEIESDMVPPAVTNPPPASPVSPNPASNIPAGMPGSDPLDG